MLTESHSQRIVSWYVKLAQTYVPGGLKIALHWKTHLAIFCALIETERCWGSAMLQVVQDEEFPFQYEDIAMETPSLSGMQEDAGPVSISRPPSCCLLIVYSDTSNFVIQRAVEQG